MRRLSLAVSAIMLLSPIAAFAAYGTPGELISAIQTGAPRSFSLTAHASTADKTYVSVWASGATEGLDPMTMQMRAKATVDVVSGDMKVRVRAELMAVDGVLYLKLTSLNGTFTNALAKLDGSMVQQKWMSLPLDLSMIEEMVGAAAFSLGSSDADEVDGLMTMTSVNGKNGTTYTLALTPDTAARIAMSLRDMLQDHEPVSDDFFPFRDLAEGLRFEIKIQTNAQGAFQSSTYEMSTKGKNSGFSFTGSEKPVAALKLTAPKDAVGIEEALSMLGGFGALPLDFMPTPGMSPMMMLPDEPMPPMEEPYSMEMIDIVDDADKCSWAEGMTLIMMQRNGDCPVKKATTRHGGW